MSTVRSVRAGEAALQLVEKSPPDIVFTALSLVGMSGLELVPRIKEVAPRLPVVLLVHFDDPEYRAAAARVGADAVMIQARWGTDALPMIRSLVEDAAVRDEPAGTEDPGSRPPGVGTGGGTPSPGDDPVASR